MSGQLYSERPLEIKIPGLFLDLLPSVRDPFTRSSYTVRKQ